ncbi:restriction endonuclease subunit S [Vibrio harveyi]|nr:restriction endonuclease subunit S [Vibrio harveyi]
MMDGKTNDIQCLIDRIEKYRLENNKPKDEKVRPLLQEELQRLPKIPKHWAWMTSNDISTFITNGVHSPTSEVDELGINKQMLRITDINDSGHADYLGLPYCKRFVKGDYDKSLKKGDIYISFTGNVLGKRYLVEEDNSDIVYAHYFVRWQPIIVEPKYIYYVLLSKHFENFMDAYKLGSTQPNLKVSDLKRVPLPIAPLSEQRKIAKILGDLDKKIKLNRQTNQTLEEMAQAIFKSWFVDFDPVKAKMSGEQPEGMDAATASLFPEKLVESELGLIPEGWEVGTLSNVAKYCSARTNTDTITLENYISTENMLAEKKGVTAASKLPTAKTVAAYKSGDILVSNIRPYFKKIWLAEGSGGRSNDVLGFESVSANTDSYLMNLLYQDTFFEYMTRTSKGAKMPRGDKTAIMNWEMAVPPVELREAFSAIVDKFYQLIPQNRAQNATLESLRDTLLPKLLSGEIELNLAEVNAND